MKYFETTQFMKKIIDSKLDPESCKNINYFISINAKLEYHKKNTILFRIGDKGEKFYIILAGTISVQKPKQIQKYLTVREYLVNLKNLKEINEKYIYEKTINSNLEKFFLKERLFTKLIQIMEKLNTTEGLYTENNKPLSHLEDFNSFVDKSDEDYSHLCDYFSLIKENRSGFYIFYEYENIVELSAGFSFGDFALESVNRLRMATIKIENDCYFAVIKQEDYINYLFREKKISRTKEIKFLYENFFHKSFVKEKFEKYYFYEFIPVEYQRGYVIDLELFDEKNNQTRSNLNALSSIYLIKEGQIEINLINKSLIDLHKLIEYFINCNPSLKNLENFDTENFIKKLKNIPEELSKKRNFSIFKIGTNDILGAEEFYFKLPFFFQAKVISDKVSLYRLSHEGFNKLIDREGLNIKFMQNYAVNKISNKISRIMDLKNFFFKVLDNKYDLEVKEKINLSNKKNKRNLFNNKSRNKLDFQINKNFISSDNLNLVKSYNNIYSVPSSTLLKDFISNDREVNKFNHRESKESNYNLNTCTNNPEIITSNNKNTDYLVNKTNKKYDSVKTIKSKKFEDNFIEDDKNNQNKYEEDNSDNLKIKTLTESLKSKNDKNLKISKEEKDDVSLDFKIIIDEVAVNESEKILNKENNNNNNSGSNNKKSSLYLTDVINPFGLNEPIKIQERVYTPKIKIIGQKSIIFDSTCKKFSKIQQIINVTEKVSIPRNKSEFSRMKSPVNLKLKLTKIFKNPIMDNKFNYNSEDYKNILLKKSIFNNDSKNFFLKEDEKVELIDNKNFYKTNQDDTNLFDKKNNLIINNTNFDEKNLIVKKLENLVKDEKNNVIHAYTFKNKNLKENNNNDIVSEDKSFDKSFNNIVNFDKNSRKISDDSKSKISENILFNSKDSFLKNIIFSKYINNEDLKKKNLKNSFDLITESNIIKNSVLVNTEKLKLVDNIYKYTKFPKEKKSRNFNKDIYDNNYNINNNLYLSLNLYEKNSNNETLFNSIKNYDLKGNKSLNFNLKSI